MSIKLSERLNVRLQNSVQGIILALILALFAYATNRYKTQWDWTASQLNTLAEQSITAIQSFDKKVVATIYAQKDSEEALSFEQLLERYQQHNSQMEIRVIDPELSPEAAVQDKPIKFGTLLFRVGERSETLTDINEENITNALVRLSKDVHKVIRFTQGHGEHTLEPGSTTSYSQLVSTLKSEGYVVEPINLAATDKVPEDTEVLIIAGPKTRFFPIEVERLQKWLKTQDGHLLVMVDPGAETGLDDFLKKDGIQFLDGLVIDPMAQLMGTGPTTPLLTTFDRNHPVTKNVTLSSFLPTARGIKLLAENENGVQPVELFKGAMKGWIEMGDLATGQVEFNQGQDQPGPILMGVAVEQQKRRLIAVGDSDFIIDRLYNMAGNATLFLNMLHWLADDENFIAIKPRKIVDSNLAVTENQAFWAQIGLIILLPLLLLLIGGGVWYLRKRR
ncbi:GldG family protein [Magnetococcales bacterium HHB-1]